MSRLLQVMWLFVGMGLLLNMGCGKKTEKQKPYDIRVKTTEKATLVCLTHTGPYDQMGEVFAELGEYAARKDLTGDVVGIYYDDPAKVSAEQLRSEIGLVVPEGTMPDSGYILQELPAQKVVYVILSGPYEKIAEEYPYIMRWIGEKGYQISGPVMEVYLEAGPDVPPEELVTEVRIPIEE